MGRGRSKAKTQKGKASGSRRHPEAARLHAQEVNAKRRADGKETKSTSSISRSQRRAQQHHEAKAKPVPAPTENRSRSPVRGTTAKAKAVEESSSYYEETDAEPSQPSAAPVSFSPRQRRPKQVSLSLGQEDHSQRSRAPQESRGYQPRVSFSPRQRAQPRIQRSGARPLGRVSLSPPQGHRQDQRPLQLPRKTRQVATKEASQESLSLTRAKQRGKRLHPKQSRWMTRRRIYVRISPRSACTSRNPADYGGPYVVSKPVSSDAETGQAVTVGRASPRAHPVVAFGLWENPSSFLPPGQRASQHS